MHNNTKLDLFLSIKMYGQSFKALYLKIAHAKRALFLIESFQSGHVIGVFIGKYIKCNLMNATCDFFFLV